jgi:cell wall-associated NlpC family hydrolase
VTGQTATGGSVRERKRAILRGSRTGWAPIVVVAAASAAGLLLAVGPASGQTITSKRAQAEAIMAQVDSLNGNLEQTIEAYDYANVQLQQIDEDLASNAKHLAAAKKSLVVSRARIAERLRDLYINGQGDSTLEVILGSSSLDDIIARLDAIERVSSQDAQILRTVKRYRKEVETRRSNLEKARTSQAQIVEDRAAQKQSIESQLAEQNRLLSSVKDEIAQMRAEEAQRQAALAAQARQRAEAAALAQQVQQDTADQAYTPSYETPTYDPNLPAAKYGGVVSIALQYLGVPYVWGGSSPSTGFDCSGFTSYVYAQVGIYLPHHAASQYSMGTAVPYDQLAPGDLVFFSGLGHVGIYIGSGQFVHAPHTGDVVRISSLADHGSYVGARRL